MDRTDNPGDPLLRAAAALYVLGLVLHTVDHVRRGTAVISAEVLWAGVFSTVLGLGTVVLIVVRHRLAPFAAALVGLPVAVGVSAVHLLPHWSVFSDPFPGARGTGVSAVSWAVVSVEIAGALLMGLAGLRLLRQRGLI